jgi:hypothetical protein
VNAVEELADADVCTSYLAEVRTSNLLLGSNHGSRLLQCPNDLS